MWTKTPWGQASRSRRADAPPTTENEPWWGRPLRSCPRNNLEYPWPYEGPSSSRASMDRLTGMQAAARRNRSARVWRTVPDAWRSGGAWTGQKKMVMAKSPVSNFYTAWVQGNPAGRKPKPGRARRQSLRRVFSLRSGTGGT